MICPTPATHASVIRGLRQLARRNPLALEWLTHLGRRPRTMKRGRATAAEVMRQFKVDLGRPITRSEAVALIKSLATVGAGRYVRGRNGAQTRIEWDFSTTSLGQAATQGVDTLTPLEDRRSIRTSTRDTSSGAAPTPAMPASPSLRSTSAEPGTLRADVFHEGMHVRLTGPYSEVVAAIDRLAHRDDDPHPPYLRLAG